MTIYPPPDRNRRRFELMSCLLLVGLREALYQIPRHHLLDGAIGVFRAPHVCLILVPAIRRGFYFGRIEATFRKRRTPQQILHPDLPQMSLYASARIAMQCPHAPVANRLLLHPIHSGRIDISVPASNSG